jgi:hypothetical protein
MALPRARFLDATIAAALVTTALAIWRLPDLVHAVSGDHKTVSGFTSIDLGVTSEQRRQEGGTNVSTGGVKSSSSAARTKASHATDHSPGSEVTAIVGLLKTNDKTRFLDDKHARIRVLSIARRNELISVG